MGACRYDRAVRRGQTLRFEVDGKPVTAFAGETVAAALLASGDAVLRHTAKRGRPRGVFCGMGVCFDCAMVIDGRPNVRACVTPAREGMNVERGRASASR